MDNYMLTASPAAAIADFAHLPCCGSHCVAQGQFAALPAAKEGYLLIGVSTGSISLSYEEQGFVLGAGNAAALPASRSVPLLAESSTKLLYAVVTGEAAERLLGQTLKHGVFFPLGCAPLAEILLPLMQADEMGQSPTGAEVSAAAYELLTQLYRKNTPPAPGAAYPPLVCDALAMLREDFSFLYGVEDLAERLHVSAPHLIRTFTQSVGVSPGKYLTHLRVEYAKLVLRGGETSIEAVAAASGFSGASYFGKVFRRETGMTPRAYAAAHPKTQTQTAGAIYL